MLDLLTIRELISDADLQLALPLVLELRPHVGSRDRFEELLARERQEGYALVGGVATDGLLVALAGYRTACTLARGPHLFVDDLVTQSTSRSRGYGRQMIHWLRHRAKELGLTRVYLDSRDTAVGFYEKEGFTLLTSKPCWILAK